LLFWTHKLILSKGTTIFTNSTVLKRFVCISWTLKYFVIIIFFRPISILRTYITVKSKVILLHSSDIFNIKYHYFLILFQLRIRWLARNKYFHKQQWNTNDLWQISTWNHLLFILPSVCCIRSVAARVHKTIAGWQIVNQWWICTAVDINIGDKWFPHGSEISLKYIIISLAQKHILLAYDKEDFIECIDSTVLWIIILRQ